MSKQGRRKGKSRLKQGRSKAGVLLGDYCRRQIVGQFCRRQTHGKAKDRPRQSRLWQISPEKHRSHQLGSAPDRLQISSDQIKPPQMSWCMRDPTSPFVAPAAAAAAAVGPGAAAARPRFPLFIRRNLDFIISLHLCSQTYFSLTPSHLNDT